MFTIIRKYFNLLITIHKLNPDVADDENSVVLNTCKVLVLNSTSFNLTKFLQNKLVIEKRPIVSYGQVKIDLPNTGGDYKFNLIEVDAEYPFIFHTPSSILVLCVAGNESVEGFVGDLANRLLLAINEDVDYLGVVVAVVNGGLAVDEEVIRTRLRSVLDEKVAWLREEEEAVLGDEQQLGAIEFYEQERLRNQIRLRFSVEKFVSEEFAKHGKLIEGFFLNRKSIASPLGNC